MAKLELKKNVLEVVNNQIKENNPPCTKEIYERLLDAGYSKSEAKDKIGAVVIDEIYNVLEDGKAFDEKKYKQKLEIMLQHCLDYEDDHHIRTEWDDWDNLVHEGYECFMDQKEEEGLSFWQKAWDIFISIMGQFTEKPTLFGLMDEQEYKYQIEAWLQEYDAELGKAGKDEERIAFCQKVLELFDWKNEDDSCFRIGIGDALYYEGKVAEALDYYEAWLAEDPQNVNGINSYSDLLFQQGDKAQAYEVIKKVIWGMPCYADNAILYMRARQLADHLGKKEESKWYQEQFDNVFPMLKQNTVKKETKIYPNDPCPCGSGKKYKKCCGKR